MGKVLVGCRGAELQIVSMYIEGRTWLLQSSGGGSFWLLALDWAEKAFSLRSFCSWRGSDYCICSLSLFSDSIKPSCPNLVPPARSKGRLIPNFKL